MFQGSTALVSVNISGGTKQFAAHFLLFVVVILIFWHILSIDKIWQRQILAHHIDVGVVFSHQGCFRNF